MIVARHQSPSNLLAGLLPPLPQRHLRQLRVVAVGMVQYGLIAAAMFGASAVAGVIAGVAVGLLG